MSLFNLCIQEKQDKARLSYVQNTFYLNTGDACDSYLFASPHLKGYSGAGIRF